MVYNFSVFLKQLMDNFLATGRQIQGSLALVDILFNLVIMVTRALVNNFYYTDTQ